MRISIGSASRPRFVSQGRRPRPVDMRRRPLLKLVLLPLALWAGPPAAAGSVPLAGAASAVYDVRAFGAVGDGTTLDTLALQNTIDRCSAAGGGTVLVAGGTYLTGTLYLKSDVCLRIEAGATILGSAHLADYATDTHKNMYKNEAHLDRCLLFARDAHNLTLEGHGRIDGQGGSFPNREDPAKNRPMLLRLLNCSGLRLRDLTLQNPASWTSAWLYCTDIVVDGIAIRSRANINGDGLDFDGCQGVRVSNSRFDNSDDCICLQTSRPDRPCRDITIGRCHFTSRWAGLRIGLLSRGDFENITVADCTFRDITDSGLKIQLGEGAVMKNMVFTNLVMTNVLKPVFMTFGQHRAHVDAPPELAPMKTMRGFIFSHILVETETGGKDAAFILTGLPGHPIEDVTLSDIRATFAGGGTVADAANLPDELTPENLQGRWPEYSRFSRTVPARGLYARHVQGLTLRNVDFRTLAPDARPAVVFDDVHDTRLSDAPAPVFPQKLSNPGTNSP